MTPRDPIELSDAAKRAMALQDYARPPEIEGVQLVELKRFTDDGGNFTELGRLSEGVHAGFQGFEAHGAERGGLVGAEAADGQAHTARLAKTGARSSGRAHGLGTPAVRCGD